MHVTYIHHFDVSLRLPACFLLPSLWFYITVLNNTSFSAWTVFFVCFVCTHDHFLERYFDCFQILAILSMTSVYACVWFCVDLGFQVGECMVEERSSWCGRPRSRGIGAPFSSCPGSKSINEMVLQTFKVDVPQLILFGNALTETLKRMAHQSPRWFEIQVQLTVKINHLNGFNIILPKSMSVGNHRTSLHLGIISLSVWLVKNLNIKSPWTWGILEKGSKSYGNWCRKHFLLEHLREIKSCWYLDFAHVVSWIWLNKSLSILVGCCYKGPTEPMTSNKQENIICEVVSYTSCSRKLIS